MRNVANALLAAVMLVTPLSAQRGHGAAGSMSRSVTSIGGHANHTAFPRAVFLVRAQIGHVQEAILAHFTKEIASR